MSFEKIRVTGDHSFLTGVNILHLHVYRERLRLFENIERRSKACASRRGVPDLQSRSLANLVCAAPEIINLVQKNEPLRRGFIWSLRAITSDT